MDGILGRIIAIVLGLLALIGIAYAGYNGFQNHKAGVVVQDITQLITNARAGFSQGNNGYLNFTTANAASMITSGMFPADMVRGNTVYDPWGNRIQMAPFNGVAMGMLTFGGGGSQTARQCASVATGLKDYVQLLINGFPYTQANPPDYVTASALCSAATTLVVVFQ